MLKHNLRHFLRGSSNVSLQLFLDFGRRTAAERVAQVAHVVRLPARTSINPARAQAEASQRVVQLATRLLPSAGQPASS